MQEELAIFFFGFVHGTFFWRVRHPCIAVER
jgi:hypothetical protein